MVIAENCNAFFGKSAAASREFRVHRAGSQLKILVPKSSGSSSHGSTGEITLTVVEGAARENILLETVSVAD